MSNMDAILFIILLFYNIIFLFVNRNNVDKREALENLDLILLCLDEIVDGGYAFIFSHILLLLYELNSFCLLKVFPPLKDDT
jgi:hypothetical protein